MNKSEVIGLTYHDIILFLNSLNISYRKETLIRISNKGLIIKPLYYSERNNKCGWVYYHPITIIEILTMYYLMKGIFPSELRNGQIIKFTCKDVYFARFLFYKKYPQYLNGLSDHYTAIDASLSGQSKNSEYCVYMHKNNINSYLAIMDDLFVSEKGFSLKSDFGKIYKNFIVTTYSKIYNFLYSKYYQQIINIEGDKNEHI